jgi:Cd2+/Zn2+-exporting ATPase
MKKELLLEGLNCPNCAAKIQNEVLEIEGVSKSEVNLMTQTLIIEFNNTNPIENIITQIVRIVKNHEPDVSVKEKSINYKEIKEEKEIKINRINSESVKILIGAAIYIAAILIKSLLYVELTLFIISYLIVGGEVLLKAFKNILKGEIFDENFLMIIATIGAFAIGEYSEAVGVMLFYQVGEYFQDMAVDSSRKSIKSLMNIRPDYANLKIDGDIKKVNPDEVKVNDIIIVKPGEKVALDGIIIDGTSSLDTSALTGESVPRTVRKDDEVLSGSINKNGLLTIKVTKIFQESTASKILNLVENAATKKAKTENFITKFAKYYTPFVVISAVLLASLPPLLFSDQPFREWLYRALTFLVISCPCALVISIPLGFFGGIGTAAKKGILVKGGNYLEALNKIDTVIFDKTGTLTKGVFKVTNINPLNGFTKESLLNYAALAEKNSNHPIAKSIIQAYNIIDKEISDKEHNLDFSGMDKYEEFAGLGIKTVKDGNLILAGNLKLLEKYNIKIETDNIKNQETENFGTIVYIAINSIYAGSITISDEIKDDAIDSIKKLKDNGIKTIMLTGDNKETAEKIGKKLGIDQVFSNLLPAEKVEKLEMFKSENNKNGKVLFAGDGINDAPVLARADIGVSMGNLGSDAAIEASDIVLMTDEISKLQDAFKIAKRTQRIVIQNIVFALSVKGIILVLGAFGIANMWFAVFADVGVTLIAILNAMRVGFDGLKKS